MDFFSKSELVTQIGHDVDEWSLVFVKECVDNALDACEENEAAPIINVSARDSGIFVADNGPGIPESTVEDVLDYSVRTSSREAYVSPSRGRQGNALQTLAAMPFVLSGSEGALFIKSHGECRMIRTRANALTQTPEIEIGRANAHAESKLRLGSESSKTYNSVGTTIGMEWPKWPFESDPNAVGDRSDRTIQDRVLELLRGYVLFNPHMTLSVDWFGRREHYRAATPGFRKWCPNQPSSSHWYTAPLLSRLIGASIAHDQRMGKDRTISDFLTTFDGLRGTAKRKRILASTGLSRVNLSKLANERGLDESKIGTLLDAMKSETKVVKPIRLGVIGKEHFSQRLDAWGCKQESIKYAKFADFDRHGLPVIVEVCFGVLERSLTDVTWQSRRQMFSGANFSSAIKNPFREFGSSGEGLEGALARARVDKRQPVIFAAHVTRPIIPYTDRGKSAIAF